MPLESTFFRAFAEFSRNKLAERVHQTLTSQCYKDDIVGHISRDSTTVKAREKPHKKEKKKESTPKRKPGRPKKGEEVPKKKTRIEKQASGMSLHGESVLKNLTASKSRDMSMSVNF